MVSASDALDTLLGSGETVLDCGAAAGLAYQLAARTAFEVRHGKEKGRLRFDYLWGSARFEVPKVQRLLITNNGMVAGTEHFRTAEDGNINPLNPFAFFVGFTPLAEAAALAQHMGKDKGKHLEALKRQLKVGSLVMFNGHPEYYSKHPSGLEGGYNAVVAEIGTGPLALRFFGDVAETAADDLDLALEAVRSPPLTLSLEGVGFFGEGPEIHAVWAGVADNDRLRVLAGRCEAAARRAGLAPDKRGYRPHVTLAYLRRPDPAQVAAWVQSHALLRSPPFEVTRFGLYSSANTSEGSRYALERSYGLRG